MKKQILAQELRERIRKKGLVPEDILFRTSNQDIIESYVECRTCRAVILSGNELDRFILEVMSTDEFVRSLDFPCGHVGKSR